VVGDIGDEASPADRQSLKEADPVSIESSFIVTQQSSDKQVALKKILKHSATKAVTDDLHSNTSMAKRQTQFKDQLKENSESVVAEEDTR